MKYDYEYKRKAVEKYRKGELMKTLEGANETNFRKMIRKWVQLEYACNPEVLKQKSTQRMECRRTLRIGGKGTCRKINQVGSVFRSDR